MLKHPSCGQDAHTRSPAHPSPSPSYLHGAVSRCADDVKAVGGEKRIVYKGQVSRQLLDGLPRSQLVYSAEHSGSSAWELHTHGCKQACRSVTEGSCQRGFTLFGCSTVVMQALNSPPGWLFVHAEQPGGGKTFHKQGCKSRRRIMIVSVEPFHA